MSVCIGTRGMEEYRKVLCIDKGPRMFRDRKPICNVLRGGFEILNSGKEGEVVDYPSTSSVSAPPFRDSFLQDNNVTYFFLSRTLQPSSR